MELKINKEFAKHYNDYRAKEEASKTKKTLKKEIKQLEESSSSSDSEYEECYQRKYIEQCDDILRKIKNDSKITSKLDGPLYKEIIVDSTKDKVEKPIYVKDLNRKILLDGGIENEEELMLIEKCSKLDSEDILNSVPSNNLKFEFDSGSLSNDDEEFLKPSSKPPMFVYNHMDQDNKKIDSDIEDDDDDDVDELEVPISNKIEINRDRKLETVRVSKTKSRAEKRKTRKENKAKELKLKMKRLQEIKNITLQEKFDKIKKNVPELAKHLTLEDLDGDFDINEFSEKMSLIYDQEDADLPIDEEKPIFSDESDVDYGHVELDSISGSEADGEIEEPRKKKKNIEKAEVPIIKKKASYFTNLDIAEDKTSKKKVGIVRKTGDEFNRDKFSDFNNYLKKTFEISCEDLILGNNDDDDIKCKFKYRKVEEQTYGLDIEDIILADQKELNKWASLKKIVRIRSNYEEEKDRKKYNLPNMLEKKKEILASLYVEELENDEDEGTEKPTEPETPQLSKSSKKRLRKKTNKKHSKESDQQIVEKNQLDEIKEEPMRKKSKKRQYEESQEENLPVENDSNKAKKIKTSEKIPDEDTQGSHSKKGKKMKKCSDGKELDTSKTSETIENILVSPNNVTEKSKVTRQNKNILEQKVVKKKKSKSNSVPVLNANRLESLGIKPGYYKHVLRDTKNQN